jgi:hypothetical protein
MKPLLITIATLLLLCAAWVTTNDINIANNQRAHLKNIAEEASAAGARHFDVSHYGYGDRVFNDDQTLTAVKDIIQTNMHLDDAMSPDPTAYWQTSVSYTVWIIDDIKTVHYIDGIEISRMPTDHYPVIINDPEISHGDALVSDASVVVKIDAGQAISRNQLIPFSMALIRSGSYQWQHRY